jgi:hypothetical protein
VVRQPLDVLLQPVRVEPFDGRDDPSVEPLAPLLEQGAVGDLVGERVLEGVLGIGKEARLVEELGRLQLREPPPHRLLRGVRHRPEQHEGNVLADDRGRLEQRLVLHGEPVDARRQDHLHRRGHLDRLDRAGQPIRAPRAGQRSRLHQRPDALLDEEGVPPLHEQAPQGLHPRVIAQQGAQELPRALRRQRVEPQLAVVGLAPPAVLVLRPVVHQQEQPSRGETLDQAVEQGLRFPVYPVQVLEDEEEGLALALPEQEMLDGIECALPPLSGIERLPGGVVDGHIEQSEQGRQDRLERAIEREELPGHLLADLAVGLAIVHPEVDLEEIDDGQVARGLA